MDIHQAARHQAFPILLSALRDLETAWGHHPHVVKGHTQREFSPDYARSHPEHETVVPALSVAHQTARFLLVHGWPVERKLYRDALQQEGYLCEPLDVADEDWTHGFRVHARDDHFMFVVT